VTFPPGSTFWLLAHELRVWSRQFGRGRAGRASIWIPIAFVAFLSLVAGLPLGLAMRAVEIPVTPAISLLALGAVGVIFALMLSQALSAATDALYQRGDFDLLFSSPLDPRRVLVVRFLAVALQVFLGFACLISALLLPVAAFGHWPWLAAIVVLASVALTATAAGLMLAMGLFAVLGPRRTRTIAQILAAFIGAAFFLTVQARNILGRGGGRAAIFSDIMRAASGPDFSLPPLADFPLRAALGQPGPLLALVATGVLVFGLTSAWLGRKFAADAAAASGAASGGGRARAGRAGGFVEGVFAATLHKEMRLLVRDPALLSQVLLRVLYMLPLGFLMIRNAQAHEGYALQGGAAALSVVAGQVAGSLAWITVSAEDAPELLASAPARAATLRRAKLSAGHLLLAVVLAPILAVLLILAPWAGAASAAGCAAAALASSLIVVWLRPPGRRSEFRRQRAGSLAATLAELVVQALIGGATFLAAGASPWMILPAALAALALLPMRRSDAQIADAAGAQG
jgi:ABC-2 type transport system permease protein